MVVNSDLGISGVVDPDPVGYETFCRIRNLKRIREKSFRIRIRAAQDLSWIWSKTTLKSEKQFLNKNAQLKNTLARQEYNGKIYVKNIKKIHVGSEKIFLIHSTGYKTIVYFRI